MLCTSGFMDDVTFGRSGPLWRCVARGVAIPERSLMSMNALLFLASCLLVAKPVNFNCYSHRLFQLKNSYDKLALVYVHSQTV